MALVACAVSCGAMVTKVNVFAFGFAEFPELCNYNGLMSGVYD